MSSQLAHSRPAEILLVEDSQTDVVLTREGFKRSKLLINLHHVENGELCMRFLRNEAPYADAPSPDLILLDLNMPVMDGREVLAEVVADEALRHLPIVVLTTAEEYQEIMTVYRLRASSYIKKPVNFNEFQRVVQGIGDYWFTIVVLPKDVP